MTRSHFNLLLLAIVGGLGAVLWYSQEKAEVFPPLTPFAQADVDSIVLTHPDAPVIELRKQGSDWQLLSPVQAPADGFEVASLVNLATLDVKRSVDASEADLQQLMLDPPAFTVTINGQELAFGGTEPIEYRRYIRTGNRVALVLDPPSAALDKDFSDLVAKQLLPVGAKVRRIEVPGLVVRRADNDQGWVADGHADVTSDQLQAFVDAWMGVRAMWNGALPPADAQAAGEAVRIEYDGGEMNLRIAEREPQLLIDNLGYQVRHTVSRAEVEKLLSLPSATPTADPAAGDVVAEPLE